jgi:hypothetical protein
VVLRPSTCRLTCEPLKTHWASSIRAYEVLLGPVLSAAVTDGYLSTPHPPAPRTDRPGRSSHVGWPDPDSRSNRD